MSLDNMAGILIFKIILLYQFKSFCFSSTRDFRNMTGNLNLIENAQFTLAQSLTKDIFFLSDPMLMLSWNPCHDGISQANSL